MASDRITPDKSSVNLSHSLYLKLFRVNQCQEFLEHRCRKHKPFTCFNWHFPGQRRRPVSKGCDYSTDVYCSKYEEYSGFCPHQDACPLLHKNTGNTEYLYHPKFYKTLLCTHAEDSEGICIKNGIHCPYAHSMYDLRRPAGILHHVTPPIREISKRKIVVSNKLNTFQQHNMPLNSNDARWKSLIFVYTFYKTKPCTSLNRSCRQGYSCPSFHDFKDTRRSPQLYNYQSSPCPNVKVDDDWGPPSDCPNGDHCIYCHTRTEQQFHIDVYKSSTCNDIVRAGYCPRGVFCAFSHADVETETAKHIKFLLENGKRLCDIYRENNYLQSEFKIFP